MSAMFMEIDRKRKASRRTVCALCREANIPVSTWWRVATGKKKAWRASTVRRLEAALAAQPGGRVKRVDTDLALAAYRGHVAAISARLGIDPAEVVASIPSRSATQDPQWALAARVRALAIYCTVIEFNLPGAVLARAIGMTKQAVSWNLKRVEDLRDDPTVDQIIESVGRLIAAREG